MKQLEIAEELAKLFISSSNKEDAAQEIVDKLNKLVFKKNNEPIDFATKSQIIEYVKQYLSREKFFSYKEGGKILIAESRDNTMFLGMLDNILKQLNSIKK